MPSVFDNRDLTSAKCCGFNRSTQHLNSQYGEGDVEDAVQTEDLLLRLTEGIAVGSLAEQVGVSRSSQTHEDFQSCLPSCESQDQTTGFRHC